MLATYLVLCEMGHNINSSSATTIAQMDLGHQLFFYMKHLCFFYSVIETLQRTFHFLFSPLLAPSQYLNIIIVSFRRKSECTSQDQSA